YFLGSFLFHRLFQLLGRLDNVVLRLNFNRLGNGAQRVDHIHEHFHRIVGNFNGNSHCFSSCFFAHVFRASSIVFKRSTYSTCRHIARRNSCHSGSVNRFTFPLHNFHIVANVKWKLFTLLPSPCELMLPPGCDGSGSPAVNPPRRVVAFLYTALPFIAVAQDHRPGALFRCQGARVLPGCFNLRYPLKETRFFFFRHGWRIDDDGRSFAPHPVPFCLDDNTSCITCKTENTAVFGEYVAYRLVFCFALRFSLDCTFFVLIVPTIFFHLSSLSPPPAHIVPPETLDIKGKI